MNKIKVWYNIRKNNNGYTVWKNKESYIENRCGGYGSRGLYTSKSKKDCIAYCEKNGIKIKNK